MDFRNLLDMFDIDDDRVRKKVEEYVRTKTKEFKRDIQDMISKKDQKTSNRSGSVDDHPKLLKTMKVLKGRFDRLKVGSYYDLRECVDIKVAKLVDQIHALVNEEKIGMEEADTLVSKLEKVFNGREAEFSMQTVRSLFEKYYYNLIDHLELTNDE
jgi:hypothetical protein